MALRALESRREMLAAAEFTHDALEAALRAAAANWASRPGRCSNPFAWRCAAARPRRRCLEPWKCWAARPACERIGQAIEKLKTI